MTSPAQTSSSPLLNLPGAVPADAPDEGIAAHYGELYKEQRLLAAGNAFVDLSHRGIIRITGEDRLTWLHLLVTQHVEQLPPNQATDALILDANGRIEHALYLVDDGASTWIHTEPNAAAPLLTYLDSMRFFYRVEAAEVSADFALVRLPAGSLAEPPATTAAVRETAYGRELFLPRAELDRLAGPDRPAGWGEPAGILADEALRVEAHRPRLGLETDHRSIPHELGLIETAVHLHKGCYRGQETVARVQNLGKPPRRLVFLHLDGTEVVLPAHGAPVHLASDGPEGRPLGFVTTAVRHHELGPIALALIKRNTDPEAPLLAGGIPAAQETVVAP